MAALTMIAMLQGCSLLTVRGPSPEAPTDCTSSRAAPAIDALAALDAALLGMLIIGLRRLGEDARPLSDGGALLVLSPALAFAGSATYGLVQTNACRRSRTSAQDAAMSAPIPPPRGAPPGWTPPRPLPPPAVAPDDAPGAPLQPTTPEQTPGWAPHPVSSPHTGP